MWDHRSVYSVLGLNLVIVGTLFSSFPWIGRVYTPLVVSGVAMDVMGVVPFCKGGSIPRVSLVELAECSPESR